MIRKLLARNVAVKLVTLPVTLIVGLASARIGISYLGGTTYAAVMLVTGLAQLLPFADFGVGAAVMNAVADARGSHVNGRNGGERARLVATLVAAQKTLVFSGVALIGASSALVFRGGWHRVLGPGADALSNVSLTVVVFVASFAFYVFCQLGYRILIGAGKNEWTSLFGMGASVLTLALTWIGAQLRAQQLYFVVAPTLAAAFFALIASVTAGRLIGVPFTAVAMAVPKRRSLEPTRLRATAAPMLVIMVALPLLLFSHRFILSHFAPNQELIEYSITAQIYAPAWAAVTGTLMALWPAFAESRIANPENSHRVLWRTVAGIALAGAVAGTLLALLIPLAARIIAHGQVEVLPRLAGAFGLLLFCQTAFYPLGMYLTRPAELRVQAICVTAMLIVGLPGSIFLAVHLGAAGPVLASAGAIVLFQFLPAVSYIRRQRRSGRL